MVVMEQRLGTIVCPLLLPISRMTMQQQSRQLVLTDSEITQQLVELRAPARQLA
jgi:hypothetical protein